MQKNLNSAKKAWIKAWGLRKKILFSMTMLLLLLGLINALTTRAILLKVLKTEFQRKGLSYARSIAANSIVDVLTQNTSRLKKLAENVKGLDLSIAYVFIIDSSRHVLAHTFNKGFPVDLAGVNNIAEGADFNIQILNTKLGLIYDIAVPIPLEKSLVGQVRLGILQNSIQKTINAINLIFMGITFFIMVIGVFLAYRISSLITRPVSRLVEATQSIQKGDFSTRIDVETKDEIGLLAVAFNEMTSCLKQMVEEIKRLSAFEERNRIALDLHDGYAQDLANIIKRLELCERFIKVEPTRAFSELEVLRESTKDTLNKARRFIHDLKSSEDNNFHLIDELVSYIKDYERSNNIKIKSDISITSDEIPSTKAKSIFYIITEAFTNIKEHAQAKNVELSLRSDSKYAMEINIRDDGKGFDINTIKSSTLKAGRWGLIGMQERAVSLGGTFAVESQLQKGTKIFVNIPLLEEEVKEKCQIL